MHTQSICVPVLGANETSFYCSSEVFRKAAIRLGGAPVLDPTPFACPCTDGLLIVYTMQRILDNGEVDIHGGYILLKAEDMDASMRVSWQSSLRVMDAAAMLKKMGFNSGTPALLN